MNKSMELINGVFSMILNKSSGSSLKLLGENKVLEMADNINSIFQEHQINSIKLPKIVVVGTQSSGKSSVLNSIIGNDILPTGSSMVTRTPLEIRMKKISSGIDFIEFGNDTISGWESLYKVNISYPLTSSQSKMIREYISKETIKLAGTGRDISNTPIIMKIYSHSVPNLSLTDLPGLIMISRAELKTQIEKLVTKYVDDPNTIILNVMASRTDLETDLGLEFVKRFDPSGTKNIIGVLTKPDLMNHDTTVADYLNNHNIPEDLKLMHGYYVVKNKASKEDDIQDSLIKEKEYFMNHSTYGQEKYISRSGIKNLTNALSVLLLNNISEKLPNVIKEIYRIKKDTVKQLNNLGDKPPENKEGKMTLLNIFISNLSKDYREALEQRGSSIGSGMRLKKIFIQFRNNIDNLELFNDKSLYTNEYFKNMIANLEGNHMSFDVPHIEVIEASLTDQTKKPIMKLNKYARELVNLVFNELNKNVSLIMSLPQYNKYPNLTKHIMDYFSNFYLTPLREKTYYELIKYLEIEESYIWSDQKDFKQKFAELKAQNIEHHNFTHLRELLSAYFSTIKSSFKNYAPKTVMFMIVKESEKNLHQLLYKSLIEKEMINLIKEDSEIENKRIRMNDLNKKIDFLINNFSKFKPNM